MGGDCIGASRSARSATSSASRCKFPRSSVAATAASWPRTTTATGPYLLQFADKGGDRRSPRTGATGRQFFSTNYRMSGPQIAVTAAQLERLECIASKRSRLGSLLSEKLAAIPGIRPHEVHPQDRCVYWFYVLPHQARRLPLQPRRFRQGVGGRRARRASPPSGETCSTRSRSTRTTPSLPAAGRSRSSA